jgi:hypothetical protein
VNAEEQENRADRVIVSTSVPTMAEVQVHFV